MQVPATTAEGICRPLSVVYTSSAFKFQPRHQTMDWRRISALDVDRVTRELDVATLQENIADITFCNLDQEACCHCGRPVDPSLLKVLRLAQLTIEYLLHCQDSLSTSVAQLEARLQASLSQQERGQQELGRRAEELKGVREESHRRRKMINTLQQLLLHTGGQSFHVCHLCDKTFMNATFLWSHIQRRHESMAEGEKQKKQKQLMEEVVEELRAQLRSTQGELEAMLEKQRQLQDAETTRQREMDAKKNFDEWKEKLCEEIDKQKKIFWDELNSVACHNSPLEEKLKAPQPRSARCSNLGSLRGEESEERPSLAQEERMEIQSREWKRKINKLEEEFEAKEMQLRQENEGLQNEKKKLQEEIKRLHAALSKGPRAALRSQRQTSPGWTRLREQAGLAASQEEMIQTLSPKKVEGGCAGPEAVDTEEGSSEEELEDSREEQQKVLEALRQNPTLLRQIRQALEDTLQERLESLGVERDAKGISTKTFLKIQQERREAKFSKFLNMRKKLTNKATSGEEEGQRHEVLVSWPDSKVTVKSQQRLLVTEDDQPKAGTLREALPSKATEPPLPVPRSRGSHGPGMAPVPTAMASQRARGPPSTPASPGPGPSSEEHLKKDPEQRAFPQPQRVPPSVGPPPEDAWDWADTESTESLEGSVQAPDQGSGRLPSSETPVQVRGRDSRRQLGAAEEKAAAGVTVPTPRARPRQAALRERKLQLSDIDSDSEDSFLQDVSQDPEQREKSQLPEKFGVSDWTLGRPKVCDW